MRRRRVLVAIARTIQGRQPLNLENIISNKNSIVLTNGEILPILHDFIRRSILFERQGRYEFVLPIFREWLGEVGVSCLAGDVLGEELASSVLAAEDAARVRSDEIVGLAQRWPTYQGREIGTDGIRAWYQQVESQKDQRLLFKILQNVKIFSEVEIREKMRTVHSFIRPQLREFVQRRRGDRRTDLVVTYVDGEGKSGQYYAGRYAEENAISQRSILSPMNFPESLETYIKKNDNVSVITILDDIVATGHSLAKNLSLFVEKNEAILKELKIPVTAIALAATADGEARVLSEIQKIEWLDFDLRICYPLGNAYFAFAENGIWVDTEERERAKALCIDIGSNIYRDNPLGYGAQGLLIVFPITCPNNSLPIFHSSAHPSSNRKWTPLFPRLVN